MLLVVLLRKQLSCEEDSKDILLHNRQELDPVVLMHLEELSLDAALSRVFEENMRAQGAEVSRQDKAQVQMVGRE